MMKLELRFVELIPKELEDGVIYVSIRFATAVHKCACGCGIKTVTPLSPTDWKLTFNGKSVSLSPSIGNWEFPCQSHYWITQNYVRWAPRLSAEEIDRGRWLNKQRKDEYYHQDEVDRLDPPESAKEAPWWKFKWLFILF